MSWYESPSFEAKDFATTDQVIRHLQNCLKVKNHKIKKLEKEIELKDLELQAERIKVREEVEGFLAATETWRRSESRNQIPKRQGDPVPKGFKALLLRWYSATFKNRKP